MRATRVFNVYYDPDEVPAGYPGVFYPVFAVKDEEDMRDVEEAIADAIVACHPNAEVFVWADQSDGHFSISEEGYDIPKRTYARVIAALMRLAKQTGRLATSGSTSTR
jgi:hypothetical protein